MTQIFLGLGLALAVFIGIQVAYRGGQLDSTYDNKDREQIVHLHELVTKISKQRDDAITGWEKTNVDFKRVNDSLQTTLQALEKSTRTNKELLVLLNR